MCPMPMRYTQQCNDECKATKVLLQEEREAADKTIALLLTMLEEQKQQLQQTPQKQTCLANSSKSRVQFNDDSLTFTTLRSETNELYRELLEAAQSSGHTLNTKFLFNILNIKGAPVKFIFKALDDTPYEISKETWEHLFSGLPSETVDSAIAWFTEKLVLFNKRQNEDNKEEEEEEDQEEEEFDDEDQEESHWVYSMAEVVDGIHAYPSLAFLCRKLPDPLSYAAEVRYLAHELDEERERSDAMEQRAALAEAVSSSKTAITREKVEEAATRLVSRRQSAVNLKEQASLPKITPMDACISLLRQSLPNLNSDVGYVLSLLYLIYTKSRSVIITNNKQRTCASTTSSRRHLGMAVLTTFTIFCQPFLLAPVAGVPLFREASSLLAYVRFYFSVSITLSRYVLAMNTCLCF